MEVAIQIGDRWRKRKAIDEQIQGLANLPPASDLSVERLDKLNHKITHQREKMSGIRSERKAIRREAFALPINRQLVSQAADRKWSPFAQRWAVKSAGWGPAST